MPHHDLLYELNRQARQWNIDRIEREAGYPKLRAKIESFIEQLPESQREEVRSALLPERKV